MASQTLYASLVQEKKFISTDIYRNSDVLMPLGSTPTSPFFPSISPSFKLPAKMLILTYQC